MVIQAHTSFIRATKVDSAKPSKPTALETAREREHKEIAHTILTEYADEIERMRRLDAEEMRDEALSHGGDSWRRELYASQLVSEGLMGDSVKEIAVVGNDVVTSLRKEIPEVLLSSRYRHLKEDGASRATVGMRLKYWYNKGVADVEGLEASARVSRELAQEYIQGRVRRDALMRERERTGMETGVRRLNSGRFRVVFERRGKRYNGGDFDTLEEANACARELKAKLDRKGSK